MWLIITAIIVTPFVALYALLKYYSKETNFWPKRGVTLVKKDEIGTLLERITLKVSLQELDARMYRNLKAKNLAFGGIEDFHSPVFLPVDLDLIKRIMVKDFDYFVNRRVLDTQRNDEFFKDMMSVKENQEWKDLRSTMSPTFSTGKIRRMYDIFDMCASRMVTFLQKATSNNTEIELGDGIGRYTLDVIAWAAFGVDSKVFEESDSVFASMGNKFEGAFKGILGTLRVALIVVFPKIGAFFNITFSDKVSSQFFTHVINKTIKHRLDTGERRQDFLQLMLDAQAGQLKADDNENTEDQFEKDAKLTQANKITITDGILRSQCLLFFLAGFTTTQNLLIFAAFELAVNQDIQERLAKEIQEGTKKTGGKLTYDVVNEMQYLDQVVSETLRKYPPGIRTERKATADYKIPGSDVIVPKDMTVMIPIWAIHYDPEYWPNPEKFDPERFTAESKANRNPFAYMPFGAGPRNCIAMRFALMEGKAAVAQLVQNFILEPSSKTSIPIKFGKITLKPDAGMWLNLKPRKLGNGKVAEE